MYYGFADIAIILNTIKTDNCRFKVKLVYIVLIVISLLTCAAESLLLTSPRSAANCVPRSDIRRVPACSFK